MLPAIRRIAAAEVVICVLVALVAISDTVPVVGWLVNPHSTVGGVSLLALLLIAVAVVVLLLVSLPVACKALLNTSSERTPFQVFVVIGGLVLLGLLSFWLFRIIQQQ